MFYYLALKPFQSQISLLSLSETWFQTQILICLCFWNTTSNTEYNLTGKNDRRFPEYLVVIPQPIIIPHMPIFGISEPCFLLKTSKHVKTKADVQKNAWLSAVTDEFYDSINRFSKSIALGQFASVGKLVFSVTAMERLLLVGLKWVRFGLIWVRVLRKLQNSLRLQLREQRDSWDSKAWLFQVSRGAHRDISLNMTASSRMCMQQHHLWIILCLLRIPDSPPSTAPGTSTDAILHILKD